MRQYPTEEEEQGQRLLEEMEGVEDEDSQDRFQSDLAYEPNPPPPYAA